jgi:hypothetical protein
MSGGLGSAECGLDVRLSASKPALMRLESDVTASRKGDTTMDEYDLDEIFTSV